MINNLGPVGFGPDPLEGIDEVRRLSVAELDRWIASGRIRDAYTLARSRGLLSSNV